MVNANDIIMIEDNLKEIKRLKKNLSTKFIVKNLGQIKYFLGMKVVKSKKGISVSQ